MPWGWLSSHAHCRWRQVWQTGTSSPGIWMFTGSLGLGLAAGRGRLGASAPEPQFGEHLADVAGWCGCLVLLVWLVLLICSALLAEAASAVIG